MSNADVCAPPFVDTLVDDDVFWENTVCSFSRPNCMSVLMPKSDDAPGMSDELEGKVTFPASTSFIISSSFPS